MVTSRNDRQPKETAAVNMEQEAQQSSPLAAAIYNDLIESICFGVACKMHRLVKTGEIAYSDLPPDRRQLYPELYENATDEDVIQALEKYAVEGPRNLLSSCKSGKVEDATHKKRRRLDGSNDASRNNESATNNTAPELSVGYSTRQQSFTQSDIWGNVPLKEPKEMIMCPVCNRPSNTIRFAPHLDKCLGIGTNARAGNGTTTLNLNGTGNM